MPAYSFTSQLRGRDSSADAVAGAQAGENSLVNNFLSQGSAQKYTDKYK
ncbi:VENN motif pre-toxin domain-containing protein [Pantoea sp. UBA5923]